MNKSNTKITRSSDSNYTSKAILFLLVLLYCSCVTQRTIEVHNRSNHTILVAKYGLKWPTNPENQLPIANGATMKVAIAENIGVEFVPILGMLPLGMYRSSECIALVCEDEDACMNLHTYSLPQQVIDFSEAWLDASMFQQMLQPRAGSVVFHNYNDVRFYTLQGNELMPPKEDE